MTDFYTDRFTFCLKQPEVKPKPPVTVEICEGSAKIVSENRVFYNPVQQFNRDLSLSVLSTFWKFCQNENEQRKSGKKVPANDFSVYPIDIICKAFWILFLSYFLIGGWFSGTKRVDCEF